MDSPFWHQVIWIFGIVGTLCVGALIYYLIRWLKGKKEIN